MEKADKEEKETSRLAASLASHQKTLELISDISPSSIWRSVVRSAEIDRRMSKVSVAKEDLCKIRASGKLSEQQEQQVVELEGKMEQKLALVLAMKETARLVRSLPSPELAKDICEGTQLLGHISKCAGELLADHPTISDVVHAVAKKLFEEPWLLRC